MPVYAGRHAAFVYARGHGLKTTNSHRKERRRARSLVLIETDAALSCYETPHTQHLRGETVLACLTAHPFRRVDPGPNARTFYARFKNCLSAFNARIASNDATKPHHVRKPDLACVARTPPRSRRIAYVTRGVTRI